MTTEILTPLLIVGRERMNQRALIRDVDRGIRVRVKRGAYYDAKAWWSLSAEQRHRVTIEAFAFVSSHVVFSHYSAAILHGIPTVGPVPTRVHVVANRATGGRSEPGLQRHCLGFSPNEILDIAGLHATTPLRTVVDLATVQRFRWGVAGADHLLHLGAASPAELLDAWEHAAITRGRAHARRTLGFADGLAANPGESMSRAVIHEFGFPRPELQRRHVVRDGQIYFTDFEWPGYRIAGEFDGVGKYLAPQLQRGLSPGDVVVAEKRREDALREDGLTFARWTWNDALAGGPVRDALVRAGLPRLCH